MSSGFECVAAYDADPLAVESHHANLGSKAIIANLDDKAIQAQISGTVDVVVAGPPCQGFSTAGKREFDDPRNHLLLIAGRLALQLSPRVFVAENVAGVASGKHRRYWDGLHRLFRESGYRTVALRLNALELGVPQIRTRMIMVAWKDQFDFNFTLPTVAGGALRDALAKAAKTSDHRPVLFEDGSALNAIAAHIKPGQKLSNVRKGPSSVHTWQIPEVFGKTRAREREVLEGLLILRRRNRTRDFGDADPVPTAVLRSFLGRSVGDDLLTLTAKGYVRKVAGKYDLTHSFNGKYRRLDPNLPSLTVDTKFGDPRYFIHPFEQRGFSVREAACIQGFPASFIFPGTSRDQYRLIGNAVPPPMSAQIATLIRSMLFT